MKKYSAEWFIAKFEKIPDDKWCVYVRHSEGKSCVLGHCGETDGMYGSYNDTLESYKLRELFSSSFFKNVPYINDGANAIAVDLGAHPKERVLNALTLIATGILKEF